MENELYLHVYSWVAVQPVGTPLGDSTHFEQQSERIALPPELSQYN